MIRHDKDYVPIMTTPTTCVTVTLFTALVTKVEGVFLAQRGDLKSISMTDLSTLLKILYLVLIIQSFYQEQQR